ncbi:hypothetical protein DYB35_013426 [Aphanomyces astaci]|uniref:Uncharacterized protein n=2 Tax=Aphanomyces astaci TaxID=112090 RepID=A0A418E062_APHAT|nr:hypothetical protein DYB35_013426 [Aphanomyces astaci]
MGDLDESTREFLQFWIGWQRILGAVPADYRMYSVRVMVEKSISYVPMQCGPNDSDVRAYVCDMPKRVKHLRPTTSLDEMRQKWIQYAKNTATPSYAIMQHTRSLANQQFEVNELRRRINASDIEREVTKRQKLATKVYEEYPARSYD